MFMIRSCTTTRNIVFVALAHEMFTSAFLPYSVFLCQLFGKFPVLRFARLYLTYSLGNTRLRKRWSYYFRMSGVLEKKCSLKSCHPKIPHIDKSNRRLF